MWFQQLFPFSRSFLPNAKVFQPLIRGSSVFDLSKLFRYFSPPFFSKKALGGATNSSGDVTAPIQLILLRSLSIKVIVTNSVISRITSIFMINISYDRINAMKYSHPQLYWCSALRRCTSWLLSKHYIHNWNWHWLTKRMDGNTKS